MKFYWSPCQAEMTENEQGGWVRRQDYETEQVKIEAAKKLFFEAFEKAEWGTQHFGDLYAIGTALGWLNWKEPKAT